MKKQILKWCLFLLIVLPITSCEDTFLDENLESSNKLVNFDYLWGQIDKKYSFFDLKNVNWLEVREQYRSQITDDMTDTQFFDLLENMLNELQDGHTNLVSGFRTSSYDYTQGYSLQIHPPLIESLFPNLIQTGNMRHTMISNQNIGYIRLPSFKDLTENQLDEVLNNYRNTNGIILDLRNNEGGSGVLVNHILSRFTQQTITVGYEQMRNGINHNNFSDYAPAIITPKGDFFTKPLVVLIDRGSYSSSTYLALSTKVMDNITLIGDVTGGGAGMPNGGQLPNGWTYRFSITRFLDINKENYAENGVEPDFFVSFDWNDLTRDEIIEFAIDFLNN